MCLRTPFEATLVFKHTAKGKLVSVIKDVLMFISFNDLMRGLDLSDVALLSLRDL